MAQDLAERPGRGAHDPIGTIVEETFSRLQAIAGTVGDIARISTLALYFLTLSISILYLISFNAALLFSVVAERPAEIIEHGHAASKEFLDTIHVIGIFFEVILAAVLFILEGKASELGLEYALSAPNIYWLKSTLRMGGWRSRYCAMRGLLLSQRRISVMDFLVVGALAVFLYFISLIASMGFIMYWNPEVMLLGALAVAVPLIPVVYRTLEAPARHIHSEYVYLVGRRVLALRKTGTRILLTATLYVTLLVVVDLGYYLGLRSAGVGARASLWMLALATAASLAVALVFHPGRIRLALARRLSPHGLTRRAARQAARLSRVAVAAVLFAPTLLALASLLRWAVVRGEGAGVDGTLEATALTLGLVGVLLVNLIPVLYLRQAGYLDSWRGQGSPPTTFYKYYMRKIIGTVRFKADEDTLNEMILLVFYHGFLEPAGSEPPEACDEAPAGEAGTEVLPDRYYIDNAMLAEIAEIIENRKLFGSTREGVVDPRYIVLYVMAALMAWSRISTAARRRVAGRRTAGGEPAMVGLNKAALAALKLYSVGRDMLGYSAAKKRGNGHLKPHAVFLYTMDKRDRYYVLNALALLISVKPEAERILLIRPPGAEE